MYGRFFWESSKTQIAEVPSMGHVPRVGEEVKLYASKVIEAKVVRVEYLMRNVGADEHIMNDELTVVKIWVA